MKNIIGKYYYICITILLMSVLLSCTVDLEDFNDSNMKIAITDIPSKFNNRYCSIAFFSQYGTNILAMSSVVMIKNGNVTLPMYTPPEYDKPFTASGDYRLSFIIENSSGTDFEWGGGIGLKTINNGTNSISFSSFIEIPR